MPVARARVSAPEPRASAGARAMLPTMRTRGAGERRGRGARATALAAALAAGALGGCFDGEALRGAPCDDDAACGPRLRCEDGRCGGAPALFACGATITAEVRSLAPSVVLVIDRSGSMAEDGRWAAATALVEGLAATLAGEVNVGLFLFPTERATGFQITRDCQNEADLQVSVGPGFFEQVLEAMGAVTPKGAAPIAGALGTAAAHLADPGPEVAALSADLVSTPGEDSLSAAALAAIRAALPRALVLVTDSAPNCGDELLGADDISLKFKTYDPTARAAVEAARAAGIPTFVVGVAIVDAPSPPDGQPAGVNTFTVLSELAAAGGTARAGDRPFYAVEEVEALAAALAALPPAELPCALALDPLPDYPEWITVEVDGAPVRWAQAPSCGAEGFRFTGPELDAIELCGDACARYRASGALRIGQRCPG